MYSSWKTQLESQQKQMKQMLQERNAARNDRMCIEKAAAEEQRKLTAQVDALQKLCRALQVSDLDRFQYHTVGTRVWQMEVKTSVHQIGRTMIAFIRGIGFVCNKCNRWCPLTSSQAWFCGKQSLTARLHGSRPK